MNTFGTLLHKFLTKGLLLCLLVIIFAAPFMIFWPLVIWPTMVLDLSSLSFLLITWMMLIAFTYSMFLRH